MQGIIAGFEYAVQPDGTCFAERRWEELRQLGGYQFESLQDQPDHRLYQTSLDQVEMSVEASRQRHQLHQALPARPDPAPVRPPEAALSTMKEPEHAAGAPFLSPTRRIRNRHNAVYGQHLPNALNSPAYAAKIFGQNSSNKAERLTLGGTLDVTGSGTNVTMMPPPARETNFNVDSSTQIPDAMVTDDVDDSLFVDLDVDQLVAQREKSQGRPIETSFDYGSEWVRIAPREAAE